MNNKYVMFSVAKASVVVSLVVSLMFSESAFAQSEKESQRTATAAQTKQVVLDAFKKTHDGWSSDEVVLQTELNQRFIYECKQALPSVSEETFNWTLLGLRKSGKLTVKTTRRNKSSVKEVAHLAEVVARSMQDDLKVSVDRIMVNPVTRKQFDKRVETIDPKAELYLVRKAAFNLRKARSLRPELISRIAEWGREIKTLTVEQALNSANDIPEKPGVYIFRDKTGYLYIGQTENLKTRLATHLDESHSPSLANYLKAKGADGISIEFHAFDPKSRAREARVRRAYESELIQSRKPRFNIAE